MPPAAKTVAILPVKRFDRAKQRLKDHLPIELRCELAAAMVGDVLEAVGNANLLDGVAVVTHEPFALENAATIGATVIDDSSVRTHSAAAWLGIKYAIAAGFDRVLLLAGDCPLLQSADIDSLLHDGSVPAGRHVVVMPDRHLTGTNALLLTPPDIIAPAFGPGSANRHVELAINQQASVSMTRIAALEFDVDTEDDLTALQNEIARCQTAAIRTQGVLVKLGLKTDLKQHVGVT